MHFHKRQVPLENMLRGFPWLLEESHGMEEKMEVLLIHSFFVIQEGLLKSIIKICYYNLLATK